MSRAGSVAEPTLVRTALAVVVLAVLDDAFLHPEPGTVAADHVVSGGVPAAAAMTLAFIYPRVPAGARGLIALCCGILAVTAGVALAGRHAVLEGPSGDDVTGLCGAVAGVVLIALGLPCLWLSRSREPRARRRWGGRVARALGVSVLGLFVVVPAGLAILITHRAREPVAAADLGRTHRGVTLTTTDGLHLAAWYVPSRNRAAVILTPGMREAAVAHARMLVRHGYGVLLFDRRGEGDSEGDFHARGC